MSSYFRDTKHPITGKIERAFWLDNYFGRREYGVLFNVDILDFKIVDLGGEEVFKASDYKWEFSDEQK